MNILSQLMQPNLAVCKICVHYEIRAKWQRRTAPTIYATMEMTNELINLLCNGGALYFLIFLFAKKRPCCQWHSQHVLESWKRKRMRLCFVYNQLWLQGEKRGLRWTKTTDITQMSTTVAFGPKSTFWRSEHGYINLSSSIYTRWTRLSTLLDDPLLEPTNK